jgi:hypothetical protein
VPVSARALKAKSSAQRKYRSSKTGAHRRGKRKVLSFMLWTKRFD